MHEAWPKRRGSESKRSWGKATAPRTLEPILRLWRDAGNPLGNHTYSHPSLTGTSVPDYLADLEKGEEILKKLEPDGSVFRVFRYRYFTADW